MVTVPPQPENSKLRGFWKHPAGISAAAAVVVALTGVIALIIGQSGGHDPVSPGHAGSSFEAETTTAHVAAAEDAVMIWARKVTAECNAIESRLVATGESIIFYINSEQVQQVADLFDQLSKDLFYFSSSISRITPPASIVDKVTIAVAKLDSAARTYRDMATAIRDIASTQNSSAQEIQASIQETQTLGTQANNNTTDGLRALGLLGATSCSNLL